MMFITHRESMQVLLLLSFRKQNSDRSANSILSCSSFLDIDGAFFGTTFPHLLMQVYPELIPRAAKSTFIPRIFGFKIHHTSRAELLRDADRKRTEQQQQQRQQQQQQIIDLNQQAHFSPVRYDRNQHIASELQKEFPAGVELPDTFEKSDYTVDPEEGSDFNDDAGEGDNDD